MRYQLPLLLASTVLVASQSTNPITSFHLQVLSNTNSTLNNTSLFACHEGAAIEGLCWSSTPISNITRFPSFAFNSSTAKPPYGTLLYNLTYSNGQTWEPLTFITNLVSNVAVPLFQPSASGNTAYLGFDSSGLLMMGAILDDRNGFVNWTQQESQGYQP